MPGRDVLELDAGRPNQLSRHGNRHPALSEELDREAGFLADFSNRRVVGQLVCLDVPTGREPLLQLPVPEQEHPLLRHDERGDGEVTGRLAG